jgi:hypothetical protein
VLEDVSHIGDEAFAGCVTILDKFHGIPHDVCVIGSGPRPICILIRSMCITRYFKYETSVKVVSKGTKHNIVTQ